MADDQQGQEAEYGLVVSFPDASPNFVHGFEAGSIWEKMCAGHDAEIELSAHVENREVIQRMAVAEGWEVESKPSGVDGWDTVKLTKTRAAPERPNPHGLRVV